MRLIRSPEVPLKGGERRRVLRGHERAAAGAVAERVAADYLRGRGYRILCRNRENSVGELDIVARQGDTIVFVEVRSRRTGSAVNARDTVTRDKRLKLARAGELFLRTHRLTKLGHRIDLVTVELTETGRAKVVEHLENCVGAGGEIG